MDIFSVLTMVGGLALFLYGMQVMGDGLAKVSGGKLERILENLTSNPIKAVLLGAGVTAVIQASSATTVMVVGFVNSGIMKLNQAVGIIMGASGRPPPGDPQIHTLLSKNIRFHIGTAAKLPEVKYHLLSFFNPFSLSFFLSIRPHKYIIPVHGYAAN